MDLIDRKKLLEELCGTDEDDTYALQIRYIRAIVISQPRVTHEQIKTKSTPEETSARNREIMAALERGEDPEDIGARYGMAVSTVKQIPNVEKSKAYYRHLRQKERALDRIRAAQKKNGDTLRDEIDEEDFPDEIPDI